MSHATYTGSDEKLRGRRALIRPMPEDGVGLPGVWAQFDAPAGVRLGAANETQYPECFGWARYRACDFQPLTLSAQECEV